MFWKAGATITRSGAIGVRTKPLLRFVACSGAVTALFWSWKVMPAAGQEARIEGKNIRLEFDNRMYSRVVARFGGKDAAIGPFSPSETVTVGQARVSDFT